MYKRLAGFFFVIMAWAQVCHAQQTRTVWLDDLAIQKFSSDIRPVNAKQNYGHDTIQVKGIKYQRGVGVQTISILSFLLNGRATHFSALAGADDHGNKDIPVTFYVIGDKKILFESPEMRTGDAPLPIELDIRGIKRLGLLVTDKTGGIRNKRTYSDWINAKLEMTGQYMPELIPDTARKYILTPAPRKIPGIHSPKIFGARPGNPFLYTIAATGEKPVTFAAKNLPAGLSVSAKTGIITGMVKEPGTYEVILQAKNRLGQATQKLLIRIGDTISLTPPMGWNGWNAWESAIDREKVIASADAMVRMGLRDHGWSYINIDDSWQGIRSGPDTALQPNEKFPGIQGMISYIHSLGLKAGLYSTPYIASYAGYVGASSDYPAGGETHDLIKINRPPYSRIAKYKFETNDAKQMAAWGVDFLKYDWRIDVVSAARMSEALKNSGRDIVFSLSNNAPIEKAGDWMRLANMYRTGPDIKDSWNSLYQTTFSLDAWAPYTGPGHWSDPDMMIVGDVSIGTALHPTRLTPDEQYSHVSMFSLLSAPMLIGCPIERLDAFTHSLLTNDEVIAVNQDPLGKPAKRVLEENGVQVWVKPLEDGDYAVGLFNTDAYGSTPQSYFRWGDETVKQFTFDFAKAGLTGSKWKLRDLWRQQDLGEYKKHLTTQIPYHGVVMLRMTAKQ